MTPAKNVDPAAFATAWAKLKARQLVEEMRTLSESQRAEVLEVVTSVFCTEPHCGALKPCNCWNDE